jgi:hypothetical protein
MSRLRRPRGLMICPMLLALLWAAACDRPAGPQTDVGTAPADQHQVPFHGGEGLPADHSGDSHAAQANGSSSDAGLPFHDPQNLPAGTLLTVRLKYPISAENPGANGTFEAVIDEPVVIEGNRLVPSGTTVAGRVESARASSVKRNRGYVRLALDSIHLAGETLPIRTSSLFVRGNPAGTSSPDGEIPQGQGSAAVIRLEKGRRLTFRLTDPVYVAASERTKIDR